MIDSLAISDPGVGDSVTKKGKTRTVTRRVHNEIYYVTEKGVNRSCWLSTWVAWARYANEAVSLGKSA